MRVRHAALAVLLACALAPATAAAGEVRFENGVITVTGDPTSDTINASHTGYEGSPPTAFFFTNSVTALTAGPGCTTDDTPYDDVKCDTGDANTPVVVDLGGGNDTGTIAVAGTLRGGAGDDVLSGDRSGAQTIDGGEGNDTIDGDTTGYCSEGPKASGSPDDLAGGPGVDTVKYDGNLPGVTVSLNDAPDDGQAGEGDNVRSDVENLSVSTCAANTIVGSDGPNVITTNQGSVDGRGGDDTITTSSLADQLSGGDGNDKLLAGGGNDTVDGGAGDDYVEGGFDDDTVTGGPGTDSLVGDTTASNTIGTGNDTINGDDGIKESVSCGPGADVANLDALDDVPVDTQNLCETVKRSGAAGPGGGAGGGGGAAARAVQVSKPKLTRKRSRLQVRVRCATSDKAGCNGSVSVKVKGARKPLAKARSISLAAGKSRTVTFKLNRKARKAVARRKRTKLVVTTKLRTSDGRKTVTQTLTVKR